MPTARTLVGHPAALFVLAIAAATMTPAAPAQEPTAEGGWTVLFNEETDLDAFREPHGDWKIVGEAMLRTDDPARLTSEPGRGVMINDPPGRTRNLETIVEYGDLELEMEFMVPERSNSGVKFNGLYEVQIYDSYGAKGLSASGNGGVYPRAELLPRYHHIDEGFPPRVNASKPPGEWQSLHVVFRSPRFDGEGRKVANARFETVVLNGETIHEGLEIPYPTGHAWRTRAEVRRGPLFLQADHGPVAFRNVRVRPLEAATE